jgi:putative ABC transport system permease protein
VLRLVLGYGLRLAAVGLVVGLVAAGALTRFLTATLFEVQPLDIQVYLAVVILVGSITLAASYIPARRAAGVDPMRVLTAE